MSSALPSTPLRLRTFGGLAIEREGNAVVSGAGAQRRPLALLAQLAAAGDRGISRAKLVGLLWPDSDEEKARRVLAQTLYSLRRDLGAEELIVGTTDLRLNAEIVATDIGEFGAMVERGDLRDAAGLYEGPFLDGFYLPGAPEFERWAEETRSAVAHRYMDIVERLAEDAVKKGAREEEVPWRRKLAAADPLSAKHALRLMEALARAGDRASALQHARVHEALMRAELDAGPDPSVVAFAERLRAQVDGAGAGAGAGGPPNSKITSTPKPLATRVTPAPPFRLVGEPNLPANPTISGEFGATQEWMLRLAGGRFDPRISGNPPLQRTTDSTKDRGNAVARTGATLTPIEPIPLRTMLPNGQPVSRAATDARGRVVGWIWIVAALATLALVALAVARFA